MNDYPPILPATKVAIKIADIDRTRKLVRDGDPAFNELTDEENITLYEFLCDEQKAMSKLLSTLLGPYVMARRRAKTGG